MLRSDLCYYSEAYVWIKGNVTANANNYNADNETNFAFKNNAPFLSCISKINGKLVENAEDLDVVMPMYNLLEYSKNYEKTSGSLFNYYRDEPDINREIGAGNQRINISMFGGSFDYKSGLNNKLPAAVNNIHTRNGVEIAIPLKYLANFWRMLNILLINCEVSLELSWTDYFVKYKLAVEIDEHNHEQRDNKKELMRENTIKQKLGFEFIRINPDDDKFNINIEIGRIFEHIKEIKDKEISKIKRNDQ